MLRGVPVVPPPRPLSEKERGSLTLEYGVRRVGVQEVIFVFEQPPDRLSCLQLATISFLERGPGGEVPRENSPTLPANLIKKPHPKKSGGAFC